jgi:hypothetical protein
MQQPFGVKALAHASRRVVQKARVQELNDATDAAGLPPEAAAMDLFDTVPTTLNGIIDALFYMRIQHRNNGEHMIEGRFEDEDGERYIDWRDVWLETLIQTVVQLVDAARAPSLLASPR